MKLGMHASAWCEQWDDTALYAIDEVKSLGLDFIEIPLTRIRDVNTKATREKLLKAGLQVVTSALITNPRHDVAAQFPCRETNGFFLSCVTSIGDNEWRVQPEVAPPFIV
jgi:hypothetical protein